MLLHDFQEPIVLDVPERLVGLVLDQESEVRQQLAEPDLGRELMDVGELLDQLVLGRGSWHEVSDLGLAGVGPSQLADDFDADRRPGASLAIRVARVTPLYTTSTPSEAS